MNIVIFDGVCNFCNKSVQWIIRHDKNNQIKFAAHQSEAGVKLLNQYGLSTNDIDTVVLIKEGIAYKRSDAFIQICRLLKGFPRYFSIIRFIPRFIRDFFYNIIAKYRYKLFGKKEQCMIPTPGIKEKFLH
ncbi:MAG: thiol-disulfide oxidoreductase DCC family protein [Ferruginibacter sp.]|nr:thiol-disulfide oxidoreductase DCC family protein [Ferruginibacter sp.]